MKNKNKSKNRKNFIIQTLVLVGILVIQMVIPMFTQAGNNLTKIAGVEVVVNEGETGVKIIATSKSSPNDSKITKIQVFKTETPLSQSSEQEKILAMEVFNGGGAFDLYYGMSEDIAIPANEVEVQYYIGNIYGYYYILATNELNETWFSRKKIATSTDTISPTISLMASYDDFLDFEVKDDFEVKEIRIAEVTKQNNVVDFINGVEGIDYSKIEITPAVSARILIGTSGENDFQITQTGFYELCAIDNAGNMKTIYISLQDLINMEIVNDLDAKTTKIVTSGNLFDINTVKFEKADRNNGEWEWNSVENFYTANLVTDGVYEKTIENVEPGPYCIYIEDEGGNTCGGYTAIGKTLIDIYVDDVENPTEFIISTKALSKQKIENIYFVHTTESSFEFGDEIANSNNEIAFSTSTTEPSRAIARIPYNSEYTCVGVLVEDEMQGKEIAIATVSQLKELDRTAPIITINQPSCSMVGQGREITYRITTDEPVIRTNLNNDTIQLLTNGESNGEIKKVTGSGTNWEITVKTGRKLGETFLKIPAGFFEDAIGNETAEKNGDSSNKITIEEIDILDLAGTTPTDREIIANEEIVFTVKAWNDCTMDLQEGIAVQLSDEGAIGATYVINEVDDKIWEIVIKSGNSNGYLMVNLPEGMFKEKEGNSYSKGFSFPPLIVNNGAIAEDITAPRIISDDELAIDKSYETIKIKAIDDKTVITTMKIASGEQTKEFFTNNGVILLENGNRAEIEKNYDVRTNGKYTIYVKDVAGNETIKVIDITRIENAENNQKTNNENQNNTVTEDNNVITEENNIIIEDNTMLKDDTQSNKIISQLGQSNFIIYEIILFAVISVISYIKYVKVL